MGKDARDAKHELLELDDPLKQRDTRPPASDVQATEVETPTLIPQFDPAAYAEESDIRERMPTLTDDDALESARLRSLPSYLPPARAPASTRPGPLTAEPEDSVAEVDMDEADLDVLPDDEQVAILRARLAPLTRVPALARPMTELGPLLEDPKTAYVLGFVDGILPLETIIEVTGLPELDTLRVLDRMLHHGVLVFTTPPPGRSRRPSR
ncbi:MAG: hypothetical protein KF819_27820 [Labilithrix sp.]|nr:hypothetical protein [Labilithrix sp.]